MKASRLRKSPKSIEVPMDILIELGWKLVNYFECTILALYDIYSYIQERAF